ncbi:peptidoglycan-associated lipoprotein Pal [Hirschia baltica]|uniref:Peptidoglycan-associated lipoprotein n=1 Tax=Hirschia baltica (strain ATCC 49814 / DSM 5838 / IFAM 1418) TaxID=582402 RepID=C6XND3_HIRBI|nr:peptidoglycan-associated lipoprotein Pal [Hirschia baltica]ACT60077.1 peptidoglycan-associated lipoprotein [Hirschia baltica ATCC 49814]
MNYKVSFAALTFSAAALASGCASTVEEPAPVPTPTPVATPAPVPTPTPTPVVVPQGPIPGSLEDFNVNVGSKIFYDVDQYSLDDADRQVLARQAAWLNTYPGVSILIAGNCDERGTREYNIALGERRAAAAKDYLMGLGVSAARIETVSYGKERPTDPRSTTEAWSVNRNAHTQLISGVTG